MSRFGARSRLTNLSTANQVSNWHGNQFVTTFTPTGSFESISPSYTLASPTSTVTFSGIPATYQHLQIRVLSMSASGTPEIAIQFNGASSTIYSQHALFGDGATATAYGAASQPFMITWQGAGGSTTNPAANIIDILDYANINKYTTIRSLTGRDNNGSGTVSLNSGSYQATTAISSITLTTQTSVNFATYSSFALYGVNG